MGEIDEWEHDALLQLEALIDERCRAAVEERDREWSQALLPGCTVGWVREKLKQPGFAAGVLTEEKTIAIEEAVAERDKEWAQLVKEWICTKCRVVYPGPPRPGVMALICPECGDATMPRCRWDQQQAVEAAVAKEREECAKVVEDMASSCEKWADGAPLRIAVKAIRARGERGDG